MNDRMLASIIVFLIFLTFISGSILTIRYDLTDKGNYTSLGDNLTIASTGDNEGIPKPPQCEFGAGFLEDILSGIGCVGSYVLWMVSFVTLDSDYQWLGYLFTGMIIIMMIVAVRLLIDGIKALPFT